MDDKSPCYCIETTTEMCSEYSKHSSYTHYFCWWHVSYAIGYLALTSKVGYDRINVTQIFMKHEP